MRENVEDGRRKRVVQREERALDTITEQQLFRYRASPEGKSKTKDTISEKQFLEYWNKETRYERLETRDERLETRDNIQETISRILGQGDDGTGQALLIKSKQQLFEFKAKYDEGEKLIDERRAASWSGKSNPNSNCPNSKRTRG